MVNQWEEVQADNPKPFSSKTLNQDLVEENAGMHALLSFHFRDGFILEHANLNFEQQQQKQLASPTE